MASHFDVLARERGIAYTVDAPERVLGVCDADKVQRILLNLLSNAFKFTPAGGVVRCAMRVEDGGAERVVLEVADSGPGIPLEHREAIFERFRQLEGGADRRFGGTGLGLAIARDFVGLHGGAFSVARAPEGGALFEVSLPLRTTGGAVAAAGRLSTEAVDQALQELRSPVERPSRRRPSDGRSTDGPDCGRQPRDASVHSESLGSDTGSSPRATDARGSRARSTARRTSSSATS